MTPQTPEDRATRLTIIAEGPKPSLLLKAFRRPAPPVQARIEADAANPYAAWAECARMADAYFGSGNWTVLGGRVSDPLPARLPVRNTNGLSRW